MQAVIQTARAAGWQADLYLREDPITTPPNLLGFSLYTNHQFPNVPAWLRDHDLAACALDRAPSDPPIIAGGPACTNPGPVLPFFDAFVMGDAEVTLPAILHTQESTKTKAAFLDSITDLPAVYVPGRSNHPARWLTIPKAKVVTLQHARNHTHILAARGCRYKCTFCPIPRLQSPYRPVPGADIARIINATYNPISLVAPSFAHHPDALLLLNMIALQQRYIYSTNNCHHDLSHAMIRTLHRLSTRITTGVEGVTEQLRKSVNKPISDERLQALLLTLMRNFPHIRLYLIAGLPGETIQDQLQFEQLIRDTLRQRPRCWNGQPATLWIFPTPFQAIPHTPLEREPAPRPALLEHWREVKSRLQHDFSHITVNTIRATTTAHINFALYRAGPEMADVIEGMGQLPLKAWRDYIQQRFMRLCDKHDVTLSLERIPDGQALPWERYCI